MYDGTRDVIGIFGPIKRPKLVPLREQQTRALIKPTRTPGRGDTTHVQWKQDVMVKLRDAA